MRTWRWKGNTSNRLGFFYPSETFRKIEITKFIEAVRQLDDLNLNGAIPLNEFRRYPASFRYKLVQKYKTLYPNASASNNRDAKLLEEALGGITQPQKWHLINSPRKGRVIFNRKISFHCKLVPL